MARVSFIKDNGTEIVIRNNLDNDYSWRWSVLFREDYISMKLWSPDDIRIRLMELGFEGTDKEVQDVCANSTFAALGDCYDYDWDAIDNVIECAESDGIIQKK